MGPRRPAAHAVTTECNHPPLTFNFNLNLKDATCSFSTRPEDQDLPPWVRFDVGGDGDGGGSGSGQGGAGGEGERQSEGEGGDTAAAHALASPPSVANTPPVASAPDANMPDANMPNAVAALCATMEVAEGESPRLLSEQLLQVRLSPTALSSGSLFPPLCG